MAMKVCVVGAGAVGGLMLGWMGQHLPRGEVQLSALARGATLQALREHGLRCIGADGQPTQIPLNATDSVADLGVQDLVVVAVKSPALPSLASTLAQLIGSTGVLLQAMNGLPWWFARHLRGRAQGLALRSVDHDGALAAQVPAERVVGGVVHFAASQPAPGAVRHHSGNALIIGEPAGGESTRVGEMAALLGASGFAVTASPFIQRDIWYKLWGNMTMNPVSAITGATLDRILDDPLTRAFVSAVMLEAREIGAAIGIPIDQDPEQRHAVTRQLGAFKTSMLQDVEAGRALELDALVGAVRELGAHVGVTTPHMDALMGLTRLMAQVRGLYPLHAT